MRILRLLLLSVPAVVRAQSAPITLVREIGAGESTSSPTFERIRSIAVGRDGRMYIADAGARHIKVVSAEGKLLSTIGRPGQGPGDFGIIGPIYIDKEQLVVPDPMLRRVSTFTLDGRPIRTWSVPAVSAGEPGSMHPMRDSVVVFASAARTNSLGLHESELSIVVRVHSVPRVDTLIRYRDDIALWSQRGAGLWNGLTAGFGAGGAWATWGDSVVAVADGYGGAVRWYGVDRRGARLLRTASLDRVARPTTKSDMVVVQASFLATHTAPRYAGMSVEFDGVPPRWSVARHALFADDGSLWIGSTERIGSDVAWTVFAPGARTKTVVLLPADFDLRAVRGDLLYGSGTTDEVPVVRLYRRR